MARTAIIVGAGIGGLTAAIALARIGFSVRLVEQSPMLAEVGAGIQISPNASRILRWLGLGAELARIGFEPREAVLRDAVSGRKFLRASLAGVCVHRYGSPYYQVHRADLHALLHGRAEADGVSVITGATATRYSHDGNAATVGLADGSTLSDDILIGADGIRSVIRETMLGPERPAFTGHVAWRGLVPVDALPAGLVAPDATVWVGPGRHLVTYVLRGGTLVNVVAVEERDDWRDESWTQEGDPTEMRRAFAGWHPTVRTLLGAVSQAHLWALFDRQELPRWTDGPVALLGDACHPTLPFMAQGAAMAIEDAWVLAEVLRTQADSASALCRYEQMRKPRTTYLQARARANARLFHRDGLGARLKLGLAPLLGRQLALRPLDPVYRYDANVHFRT